MIVEASTLPAGEALSADVAIVGSGAAGITLALELAKSGIAVCIVESGGIKPDDAVQDLYRGTVAEGSLHSEPHHYRQRRVGGSTTIWGGRCLPFDPIDFERRDFVPHSGWPIGHEALAAYYPAANALCEAGAFAYTVGEALPGSNRALIEGFHSDRVRTDELERFSRPTNFWAAHRARLTENPGIRLLLGANCVGIRTEPGGRQVSHLDLATGTGSRLTLTAKAFVLAAGGLEVPRLLLASDDVHARGLGNAHDQVGRFYMCHIAGTYGGLRLDKRQDQVLHDYDVSPDGIYCRRRFTIRPEVQRQEGLLNFAARLHHPALHDPAHGRGALSGIFLARNLISYEYSRRVREAPKLPGQTVGHLRNLVTDAVPTARFLMHWVTKRTLASRKFPSIIVRPRNSVYALDFHGEQAPNPDSRITLGAGRDRFGMRQLQVDWRMLPADTDSIVRSLKLVSQAIEGSGCGSFPIDGQEITDTIKREGAYGGHHIGTARMSDDPRQGVVDRDCRLHEVSNLYVAGAAVFPTSGQANPTLTVVATALRVADRLRQVLPELTAPAPALAAALSR